MTTFAKKIFFTTAIQRTSSYRSVLYHSLIILCCLTIPVLVSGETSSSTVDSVALEVNTFGALQLHYLLSFSGDIDRGETLSRNAGDDGCQLIQASTGERLASGKWGAKKGGIDFTFTLKQTQQNIVANIYSRDEPVFVKLPHTIKVYFADTSQTYDLEPAEVKRLTLNLSDVPERQLRAIQSYNGGTNYELKNNWDINREVNAADSTIVEYVFDFDIVKSLSSKAPLFLRAKGKMSTRPDNSLNYSEFYLSYRIPNKNLYVDAGRIGKQDFSANSIRLNVGLETLLPNVIDMTEGHPRLRLKPYFKGGLAFQKNLDSQNAFENETTNLLLFGECYYFIPIKERYFAIVTADMNYSDGFVDERYRLAYELAMGYETPLQDVNILFQIQSGENEVQKEGATRMLIGLLMNSLN